MSLVEIQTNCSFVGETHRSAAINIAGDTTSIRRTGKENKLVIDPCSKCNRKKSMSVSDNTIAAESLGDLFKTKTKNWS